MKRVLHIIDTGGSGGAETVMLNICKRLDHQKFRSVCVVAREGWLSEALRHAGIETIVLPASGSFNASYLRELVRIIRRGKIDVVVAHLYGSAVYGSVAGALTWVPVIAVLHGQSDLHNDGRFSSLKKRIVRHGVSRVVFVSDALKSALIGTLALPSEKCTVIPNGVDVQGIASGPEVGAREELGASPDDFLIGAVGNLRRPKAYDVLLRAASILRSESDRYKFIIAGEIEPILFGELSSLCRELELGDAVRFLGHRSDVRTLLKCLDVYVLTSDTEGFSISCVEAMAAGVPVVATRSGGPEEIIEDQKSGLLVPVRDPHSIAAAVRRLVGDQGFAQALRVNATGRVSDRFTVERMIGRYEQVLNECS